MNFNFYKILFLGILYFSLSGCYLFENILDKLTLCQECKGSPITTADGSVFYRGSRNSSASTSPVVYLQAIDSTGNISVVAGSATSAVTDGIGTAARFKDIAAIVVSPGTPTYLYVADECTVRRVDTSNWQVTTIAGLAANCADINGTGTAAHFNKAKDLALVANDLYIATDTTIQKMDLTTSIVTTIAGTNSSNGYVDAIGTSAKFWSIDSITVVGTNIYALDSTNQRIRKIDLTTANVTTVAGDGTTAILDGVGTAAQLKTDAYNRITSDGADVLFFTDYNSVRKFRISTGQVSTIVGSNPDDADGLIGSEAKSFFPKGIVYTIGGLYISNFYGVRRLY